MRILRVVVVAPFTANSVFDIQLSTNAFERFQSRSFRWGDWLVWAIPAVDSFHNQAKDLWTNYIDNLGDFVERESDGVLIRLPVDYTKINQGSLPIPLFR